MTKDIRAFFFGGKPAAPKPTPPVEPTATKVATPVVKKTIVRDDDDVFMVDSSDDDEDAKKPNQRKRLKTTKEASAVEISPAGKKRQADPEIVDSPSPRKSSRVSKSPIASSQLHLVAKAQTPDPVLKEEKPALPTIGSNVVTSPVKKVREIKGGAASFFGPGPAAFDVVEKAAVPAAKPEPNTSTPSKKRVLPVTVSAVEEKIPAADMDAKGESPPSTRKAPAAAAKSKASGATKANPGASSEGASSGLCFEGMKIAVTGVIEGCSREDLEDLILQHGGKLSAAVSGKTSFLLAGLLLEDGRAATDSSKYKAAVEKKVPIWSGEEFMSKIAAHEAKAAVKAEAAADSQASTVSVPAYSQSQQSAATTNATSSGSAGYGYSAPPASSSSSSSVYRALGGSSISSGSSAPHPRSSAGEVQLAGQLWVDKYKPQSSAGMIGSTELVGKLTRWLQKWDAVHLHHTEKIPFSKENPGARAVLLSGPPGIGKSTVAALAAKEGGYDVMELNASDTRNRKEIEAQLSNAVTCRAISGSGEVVSRKRLVIMDEVDGMGGSDRGGIAELIKVIKASKVPIICICNDRQSQKIRSLVNHCFDLKVRRPTKQQIAARLVVIAKGEGMLMEQNAAEMLVEQVGNDIRQALNAMQMWGASSSSMNYTDVKAGMNRIEKDKILRLSPFDACGSILGGSKTSFDDRYNSFFIDYSLTPLLIQQNYVDSAKNGIFRNPALDDVARMELLAKAADAVSDSDLAASAIRGQNMHWELLTTQAVFCVRAGAFVQGFQAFPGFPAWLGKNSSTSKMNRLTKEIVHHTALSIGQGFQPIRLDYVPYLRQSLLHKLRRVQEGGAEVQEVVEGLDCYGLTKEDLMENLKELQMVLEGDKTLTDNFAGIDTKVKTALTKAYNNGSHRSQVLVSELAAKVGKKGRARAGAGGDADEETAALLGEEALEELALLAPEDENNEEDDEDVSALFAAKKPAGKKAPAGVAGGGAKAAKDAAGGAAKAKGKGKAAAK